MADSLAAHRLGFDERWRKVSAGVHKLAHGLNAGYRLVWSRNRQLRAFQNGKRHSRS
jgi:hypothetical protein